MPDIAAVLPSPATAAPIGKRNEFVRGLAARGVVVSVARPASPFQVLIWTQRPDLDLLALPHTDIVLCAGHTDMEPAEILAAAWIAAGGLIGAKRSHIHDRLAGVGSLTGRQVALPVETLDARFGHLRRCNLLHLADCPDPVAMLESGRALLGKAERVLVEFRPGRSADMRGARADIVALLAASGLGIDDEAGDLDAVPDAPERSFLVAGRGRTVDRAPVPGARPRVWSNWQDASALPAIGMHPPEGLGAHWIRWCGPLGRSVFGLWLPRPGRYRFSIRAIGGADLPPATAFRCFIGADLEPGILTMGVDGLEIAAEFEVPETGFNGYVELGLLLPDGAIRRHHGRKVGLAVYGIEVAAVSRARVLG